MSSASDILSSNLTEIFFGQFNSNAFDGCGNGVPYPNTWQAAITLLILVIINILIIIGNTLVITAVFVTKKLRTTTNLFIMSLAIADFFVGVAVLPYSLSLEVLDAWIFGDVWCSLWLAIDVLLCTASILHLCAISLDRYLAITHPISYPRLMSRKRSRILVTAVWLAAFAISIPPLLGWNETGAVLRGSVREAVAQNGSADVIKSVEEATVVVDAPCYPTCDLIADKGYRIYSALGSFFIPMFVMVFFYWRIYIEATKSTKAMKRGFKEVSGGNLKGEGLRIHRGGASHRTSNGSTSGSQYGRSSSVIKVDTITCVSSSPPSPSSCSDDQKSLVVTKNRRTGLQTVRSAGQLDTIKKTLPMSRKFSTPNVVNGGTRRSSNLSVNCDSLDTLDSESLSGRDSIRQDSRFYKVVKLRRDFRKFSHEMKAAKTLAIIVGGFIICWLPFFTIYFIGAFCEDCIDPLLFSICFWLGYCNSALNPIVYALFNKDYRYAFQKIVRCNFNRNSPSRVTYGSGDSLTLYRMPSSRRQNGKMPAC